MSDEHERDEQAEPVLEPDELDRALDAAWGEPDDAGEGDSVLRAIWRLTGSRSRVLLRDVQGDPTPVVRLRERSGKEAAADNARYQVLGEVARGGVGVIFKGRDRDLGRFVALKVLRHAHMDSPTVVERLVEEAQIGGQLQHPGIVPVYELGLQKDGRPYFAMKLVKGRTLAAQLGDRPVPQDRRTHFLKTFEQVCQTIGYAHARGVIHRDLKPANIMTGAYGEVVVVDWGFAKVLQAGGVADEATAARRRDMASVIETVRSGSVGSESVAGSLMGTPAYMSPEQAAGAVDKVDERADVFGLGAILCEILTGAPPYVGKRESVVVMALRAKLDDALERLDSCGADDEIVQLARDCLAPSPLARPKDGGVVAQRIAAWSAGREERLHAVELEAAEARGQAAEATKTAAHERRARRLGIALATAVSLALLVGGAGVWWLDSSARDRTARADEAVVAAIESATLLRGEARAGGISDLSRWPDAVESAHRAVVLADAGEASATARGRARRFREDVLAERDEAAAVAEVAGANQAFADRLLDLRARRGLAFDAAAKDGDYRALFAGRGLDLEAEAPATVAARLRESPIAADLVAAVDDWVATRLEARPESAGAASRLLAALYAADPDKLRTRIRDRFVEGDADALATVAAGVDVESLPIETVLLLGDALGHAGEVEQAVYVLRAAQRRSADDPWANAVLGWWLLQSEKSSVDAALRFLSVAYARGPESPALGALLGDALEAGGDADGAIEVWRGVAEEPGYEAVRDRLVAALDRKGKTYLVGTREQIASRVDSAGQIAKEMIDLAPASAVGWELRGLVHRARGDYAAAVEPFAEGVRRDPESADLRMFLGQALWHADRYEDALASYQEAVRLEPTRVSALGQIASLYQVLERYDEAVETLDALLAREDLGLGARAAHSQHLACLHAMTGDLEAACRMWEAMRIEYPIAASQFDQYLLFARHDLGQIQKARAVFDRLLSEATYEPVLALANRTGLLSDLVHSGISITKAHALTEAPVASWRDPERARRLLDEGRMPLAAFAARVGAMESSSEEGAAQQPVLAATARGLWGQVAVVHYFLGDHQAALEALDRSRMKGEEASLSRRVLRAGALGHLGRLKEGRNLWDDVVEQVRRSNPHDPTVRRWLRGIRTLYEDD